MPNGRYMEDEWETSRVYRDGRVDLANELIRWLSENHEHHVPVPDEHAFTHLAPDDPDRKEHNNCWHADKPYVDSLDLDHFLQVLIKENGGEVKEWWKKDDQ